jgi:DNA-binding NtrC family response regulator
MTEGLLDGKRVLIVDDEPDILEALKDLLPMCEVFQASTYKEAARLLEEQALDITILDIMGVKGYALLEKANQKGVMAVMLTAHALSPKDTVKSFKKGAASYIPKEEMVNIVTYLTDILEAKAGEKHFWRRWLERFASYYDKKFGSDWQKEDKEFWEKFTYWY